MKGLFKVVYEELTGNSGLIESMEFTDKNRNIRRGYGLGGTWDRLITFYTQPETLVNDISPDIRKCPLLVTIYDRENDLLVDDISEQVISILNGIKKKIGGEIFVNGIFYRAELIPLMWNEKVNSWNKCLVFDCIYKKIN